MLGATLSETLKQLMDRGQVEVMSWVCRRCGYPNPPGLVQCRGYLDALRGRAEREIPRWFYRQSERSVVDIRDGERVPRCVFDSVASKYGRGSTKLEYRRSAKAADHPRFLPTCEGQEGYFVVPCTGSHAQDHGGELIPMPNNTTGISRRESCLLYTSPSPRDS